MIREYHPVVQALLGTLLTWGLTAAGSALVFFMSGAKRSVLDGSLGFAAGVMTAASFWSLLDPAVEMAETSRNYGRAGEYSFIPVAGGFVLGATFVFLADNYFDSGNPRTLLLTKNPSPSFSRPSPHLKKNEDLSSFRGVSVGELKHRGQLQFSPVDIEVSEEAGFSDYDESQFTHQQWKRILLLIIAITVHNIPEGLAVGVGFGAVNKTRLATFNKAKNLAIGVGIQNFPEGLAVSLPLHAAGYDKLTSFWYGQLSGMVEPVAGIIGAALVHMWEPLLPWALAFAAGAMICVVVDDIVPEAHSRGNGRCSSYWCIVGFVVMMVLDVALG